MKALLEVVSYGIENKFGSHYTWYTNIHVYELLSVYTHFHIELNYKFLCERSDTDTNQFCVYSIHIEDAKSEHFENQAFSLLQSFWV